jgi:hypothetical protein
MVLRERLYDRGLGCGDGAIPAGKRRESQQKMQFRALTCPLEARRHIGVVPKPKSHQPRVHGLVNEDGGGRNACAIMVHHAPIEEADSRDRVERPGERRHRPNNDCSDISLKAVEASRIVPRDQTQRGFYFRETGAAGRL